VGRFGLSAVLFTYFPLCPPFPPFLSLPLARKSALRCRHVRPITQKLTHRYDHHERQETRQRRRARNLQELLRSSKVLERAGNFTITPLD